MTTVSDITPIKKDRVTDLLSYLGIDTAAWGDFKGGKLRAAANPKFCYEWNFDGDETFIVVNFWTYQFSEENGEIVWSRCLKDFTDAGNPTQQARGRRLKAALRQAFERRQQVRVIICHDGRPRDGKRSKVMPRGLDPKPWIVTAFNDETTVCRVVRGEIAASFGDVEAPNLEAALAGFEGKEAIRWFTTHRYREWKLRAQKIEHALKSNKRSIKCEVPRCSFDFEEKYGVLGYGYAHVHHLDPIGQYPASGKETAFDRLAIVCANCHAMIHRGGACRDLDEIMPIL